MDIPFTNTPTFSLELPEGETIYSTQYLVYTLDSVSQLFKAFFNLDSRHVKVIFSNTQDSPMCLRQINTILLNCDIHTWNQAAYQFSHELCHFMIPNNVTDNYRWFEESICETASLYFLRLLTHLWLNNNVNLKTTDGALYAYLFTEYAENASHKAVPFNLHDVSAIDGLKADCYQRDKNCYIANLILPIFNKHPNLWKSVPYLSSVSSSENILEMFYEWGQVSPRVCKSGIDEIIDLFSEG